MNIRPEYDSSYENEYLLLFFSRIFPWFVEAAKQGPSGSGGGFACLLPLTYFGFAFCASSLFFPISPLDSTCKKVIMPAGTMMATQSSSSQSPQKVMVGSIIDDRTYPPEPTVRSFTLTRQSSAKLMSPDIDNGQAVKSRVTILENTAAFQAQRNELTHSMFDDLDIDLAKAEERQMVALAATNQRIAQEFVELRAHYDHRFDLQISENLRTQQHISALKFENNQLKRKLELTIKKLNRLQAEFDGGEVQEDDDELSQTFMSTAEMRASTV